MSSKAPTVRRICFHRGAPAGAVVLRRFEQPHVAVAVEESAEQAVPSALSLLSPPTGWPETTEQLDVIILRPGELRKQQEQIDRWLSPPDHPEAPRPVSVRLSEVGIVRWRPGRAVIEASPADVDEVLAGLVDFAFYEAELRRMEHELEPVELTAQQDVVYTYAPRHADRAEWPRLKATMESLYTMRLAFARLEPRIATPPR